jgi:hypothetical protein
MYLHCLGYKGTLFLSMLLLKLSTNCGHISYLSSDKSKLIGIYGKLLVFIQILIEIPTECLIFGWKLTRQLAGRNDRSGVKWS